METKWEDAFHTVMAFVQFELAKTRKNGGSVEVLKQCQKTLIHAFSLMNALALTSLSSCVGELYGRCSPFGCQSFFHWKTIPLYDDIHQTLVEVRLADDHNKFANKGGWTKRIIVLGKLSEGREEALRNSSRQAHHAYVWTLDTLTYLIGHGIVTIPAPIYSLIYQELSNGMLGYMHAWRLAQIPIPAVLSQLTYFLILMICVYVPFLVEKFTVSLVFSALLAFGTVFGLIT